MSESKFSWSHIFSLLKETYKEWNEDDPFRQSAVIAYYTIFSLPGLLMIVVSIAGKMYGQKAVQGELSNQISSAIGPDAAQGIETMIANAQASGSGTIATIIGIATLIFGATGVFVQMQNTLNIIWEVKPTEEGGVKKLLLDRVTSFGIILAIGFLLLVSLLLTAVLSTLSGYIEENLPDFLLYVFYVVEFAVSIGIITLLFAMIYKVLPDVEIPWKAVWVGAFVTAVLFVIGKFALGIYFGNADPASAYGTAGSVILILLWTSYSSLILFFGAEFTQVYARRYGHQIVPSKHAHWNAEYRLKHGIADKHSRVAKDRAAMKHAEGTATQQTKSNS